MWWWWESVWENLRHCGRNCTWLKLEVRRSAVQYGAGRDKIFKKSIISDEITSCLKLEVWQTSNVENIQKSKPFGIIILWILENTIFGLKIMVKSGLEKIITQAPSELLIPRTKTFKSLHHSSGNIDVTVWKHWRHLPIVCKTSLAFSLMPKPVLQIDYLQGSFPTWKWCYK